MQNEVILIDPMYVLMLSVHGLICSHDLELGRDPDTGGQTHYVVDLAQGAKDSNPLILCFRGSPL